jgi:hypothetical protein
MNIHGINYRMIKTIVDYRPIYEGAKERAKQRAKAKIFSCSIFKILER